GGGATFIDLSTNGTRLNGRRVERAESIPLVDGDRVDVGRTTLVFRTSASASATRKQSGMTEQAWEARQLGVVVGDIVGYTGLMETHDAQAVAEATDSLFKGFHRRVAEHRGTVAAYPGDAIFAVWDLDDEPRVADAVRFALMAHALVSTDAPALTLRNPAGEPLRMGWAVTAGPAGAAWPSPGRQSVHGDAINLAFRLAGIAARDGRAPVLVTAEVRALAPDVARYGEAETISIRGRTSPAIVHAAAPLE
ncbi:MAG: adenylate cyclase, partial [Solirubrobacteraceae bacterium]|nr:adenylate cyclase [Solirubrobacteraceae bacterium]